MGSLLESEHAPRECDRVGFERSGKLACADSTDDAIDRGPRREDVADPADEVQYRELGVFHRRGACDQLGCARQERSERELRCTHDARWIVEQLAEQQLDPTWLREAPAHERDREAIDPICAIGSIERARELLGDRREHRGVELLLAGEVIDNAGERQASSARDVAHARTVKAAGCEQRLGRAQDPVAGAASLRGLATEVEH